MNFSLTEQHALAADFHPLSPMMTNQLATTT
jgi:hypothetical protein